MSASAGFVLQEHTRRVTGLSGKTPEQMKIFKNTGDNDLGQICDYSTIRGSRV